MLSINSLGTLQAQSSLLADTPKIFRAKEQKKAPAKCAGAFFIETNLMQVAEVQRSACLFYQLFLCYTGR